MTHKLIIIGLAAFLLAGCAQSGSTEEILRELDHALAMENTYQKYFLQRTEAIGDLLQGNLTLEQEYEIHRRLSDEYRFYNLDSTINHLKRNKAIALQLQDRVRLTETDLALVREYGLAGYHSDAFELLQQYSEDTVPEKLRIQFYDAACYLYGEMGAYSSNNESYWKKRDQYTAALLGCLEEGSYEWNNLCRTRAESRGDLAAALEFARKAVEASSENSREFASAAFFLATLQTDRDQRIFWLARSAIADVMNATKDYASLNDLAELLYEEGDIKRAFNYVADHCMRDALFFNGKLRPWQISHFFPALEEAYARQKDRSTRMIILFMVVSLLMMLALGSLLVNLSRRRKALEKMTLDLQTEKKRVEHRNAALHEANKVRQEYIGLYLQNMSENISKTRRYKNHVLAYIRRGNTKYLADEIMALPPIEEDISQFNQKFDETFINLYPDFVEKFNALLQEGEEIKPKGDDILTPELRVFALIKLGIVESSKIAALLHYSANTVYNYRAKIKNKCRGDREKFEAAVQTIE
ncbi:MAG: hypothetical protein J6O51_11205 [Bacteroidales bacterium]|nr:hypothetical protein [Bacteroidales bacterium]